MEGQKICLQVHLSFSVSFPFIFSSNHPPLCPPPTFNSGNFLLLIGFIFPSVHPSTGLSVLFPLFSSYFQIAAYLLVRLDSAHSSYKEKTPNQYWFHTHEKNILRIRIQSRPSFCIPTASGHLLISSLHSSVPPPPSSQQVRGIFSFHTSAETPVFWSISHSDSPGPLGRVFMLEISIPQLFCLCLSPYPFLHCTLSLRLQSSLPSLVIRLTIMI